MSEKWIVRWRSWIAPRPSRPGVWRRKEGGFLVRGRAMDSRTGTMREVRMTLLDVEDAGRAYEALRRVRSGTAAEERKIRFSDFAVWLLERKIATGEIKSAKTRERWGDALENHLIPAFGATFVDEIRRADVEAWKTRMGLLVRAGTYRPSSVNGWRATLRVVVSAAVAELELERSPVLGVHDLDTSEHPTYTEEEPNSLTPGEAPRFLAAVRERHPQHFAFVALGLATGLRPSSLRPLRRRGPTPDVLWSDGVILVPRSHTRRSEVMETTTTGLRVVPRRPVPRCGEGHGAGEAAHPARAPAHVPGPSPRGRGEGRRDAGDLGPRDREHAAPLLHGAAGGDPLGAGAGGLARGLQAGARAGRVRWCARWCARGRK